MGLWAGLVPQGATTAVSGSPSRCGGAAHADGEHLSGCLRRRAGHTIESPGSGSLHNAIPPPVQRATYNFHDVIMAQSCTVVYISVMNWSQWSRFGGPLQHRNAAEVRQLLSTLLLHRSCKCFAAYL
jgi:hypothetical protein